jgi:hypothetical protein
MCAELSSAHLHEPPLLMDEANSLQTQANQLQPPAKL